MRDIASASIAAGDSAAATRARVKLAVAPSTSPATLDSLVRQDRAHLGPTAWDSATAVARDDMYARLMERSILRTVRGDPRLMSSDREEHSLSEIARGKPAVVIFWSRRCGAALDALPAIVVVAARLRDAGTPVLFIVDEPPSQEITDFLSARKWTLPVYHDVNGTTRSAFANFGTPVYYVLDSGGAIRFDHVDHEAELIAQVGAVRSLN
ncbi:MAG: TlpA disulfide reductase family protein [Gemmatimonadaceae bacterium]